MAVVAAPVTAGSPTRTDSATEAPRRPDPPASAASVRVLPRPTQRVTMVERDGEVQWHRGIRIVIRTSAPTERNLCSRKRRDLPSESLIDEHGHC